MAGSFNAIKAGRAYVELILKDKALKQQFKGAIANVKSFANEAASLAKIPINIAFVSAVPAGWIGKTFMEFDDQIRMAGAISKATNAEFQSLNDTARELGRTTSWTSKQVAEGMTAFARMGYKSGFINESIKGAMDLARSTGTDIEFAANFLGKTLHQFNLDESHATEVADILVATANSSAQTAEDVENAFKYAAPVAKSLSLTVKDMGVLSGTLANFGIAASQAGTTLRRLEVNVADPKKQKFLRNNLHIEATDDSGNVKKLPLLLREIGDAVKDLPTGERLDSIRQLFGVYSLAGATSLVGADFEGMANAIENAVGTAAETSEYMDQGFGGAFRLATSAVEGMALSIGDILAPSLIEFSETLQGITPDVIDWFKENEEVFTSFTNGLGDVLNKVASYASLFSSLFSALGGTGNVLGLAIDFYALSKALSVCMSITNVIKNTYKGLGAAINFASTFTKAYAENVKAVEAVEAQEAAVKQAGIEITQAETAVKTANAAAEKAAIAERKAGNALNKAQIKETAALAAVQKIQTNETALNAEMTRLDSLEKTKNSEIGTLAAKITGLQSNALLKYNAVAATSAKIDSKRSLLAANQSRILALQTKMALTKSKSWKTRYANDIKDLRIENKKIQSGIKAAQSTLINQKAEAKLAQTELASANAKMRNTQAEVRNIQARKTRISISLKSTAVALGEKQAIYNLAVAERQAAETAYQSAVARNGAASSKAKDAQQALIDAQNNEKLAMSDLTAAQTAAASAATRVKAFKKIAAAIAIGGSVIALGAAFYYLSGAMDRSVKSAEKMVETSKKRMERVEEEFAVYQDYIDKLTELANKETLSNEEKEKAIRYIDLLTKKYGDLGITVDEVTGKISGLTEAQEKFNKMRAKAELAAAEAELKALQHLERKRVEQKQAMERGFSGASIRRNLEALNFVTGENFGKFTFLDSTQRDNKWLVEEAHLQRQAAQLRVDSLKAEVGKDEPEKYDTVFSNPAELPSPEQMMASREKVKAEVDAEEASAAAEEEAEGEEAVASGALFSVPSRRSLPAGIAGLGGVYEEPAPVDAGESVLENFLGEDVLEEAQGESSGAQFYVPSKPIVSAEDKKKNESTNEEMGEALSNLYSFQGKEFGVSDFSNETSFNQKKDALVSGAKQLNESLGTNIGVEYNPATKTFKVSDSEGVLEDWQTNFEGDTEKFLEYARKQKDDEANSASSEYFDPSSRMKEFEDDYKADLEKKKKDNQTYIDNAGSSYLPWKTPEKEVRDEWNKRRNDLIGARVMRDTFKDNPVYGANAETAYRNARKEFELFSKENNLYSAGPNAGQYNKKGRVEVAKHNKELEEKEDKAHKEVEKIDGLLDSDKDYDYARKQYFNAIQGGDKENIQKAKKRLDAAKKTSEEYEKGLAGYWVEQAQAAYDKDASAENKADLDRAWENYSQYLQETEEVANDFAAAPQEAHSVWNTGSRGTFDAYSALDMATDWQREKWDDQIDLMKQVARNTKKMAKDDDEDLL